MARISKKKARAATGAKTRTKSAGKATKGVRTGKPTKPRTTGKEAVKVASPRKSTPSQRIVVPSMPQIAAPMSHGTFRWIDTLRDGTHVIIRPIRKEDAELERSFIKQLSPESRRMRFLGLMKDPSEDLLRRLTDIDYDHEMAFIALVHRDGKTQEIGVSRYSTSADGKFCECAVTVSDEWHNKGLATLLMHHLIDVARTRGIRTMVSYDAVDNGQMRELASFLGFKRTADPNDRSMVVHTLAL